MSNRWLVVWLTLALLGCEAAPPVEAPPVDASVPPGSAAPSVALSPSAAPSVSASASRPPELPLPPAFTAYAAEVDRKCPFDEGDGSTAGMGRGQLDVADCQAKLMAVDAQKLAPSQRGALVDGDPNGPHAKNPGPTPSRWAETIDAACQVEGAQLWMHGGTRTAGTMEQNRAIGCLSGEDRALGFVMRSWVNARPEDVVAYVRSIASKRPPPKPRLAIWRRYAALARRTAPHKADPDCRLLCRWSDAEWIAFEHQIDRAESGARTVSVGLCAEWKELAAAFGSKAQCEEEMSSRWLPSSTGMDEGRGDEEDPKADTPADPPDLSLSPPADAAYDEATLALRRTWAKDASETKGAARYLQEVEDEIFAGSRKDLARWARRAGTWRDQFAVADEQASFMQVSSATAGWLTPPHPSIGATSRLLEGYLLRLLLTPNEKALRDHVSGRQAWGKAVAKNLETARAAFKKPCKPSGMRDCAGTTPRDFGKVAERIDWLLSEASTLGGQLCKASPELEKALGSECASLTTTYLLSFAKHAGDPEMLDGW
ncbi:MAG: hypothetical protein JNK04_24445 [Myxococcales bacterium]|nr:hypothetical protein [Myxococcales bacterium]